MGQMAKRDGGEEVERGLLQHSLIWVSDKKESSPNCGPLSWGQNVSGYMEPHPQVPGTEDIQGRGRFEWHIGRQNGMRWGPVARDFQLHEPGYLILYHSHPQRFPTLKLKGALKGDEPSSVPTSC